MKHFITFKKDNKEISIRYWEKIQGFWVSRDNGEGMLVKEELIYDLLDKFMIEHM
jgi:hypothetical protein